MIRGRFAPSPSGRMHLGNVFAALLAWLDIRSLGGEMLLRMEDLDPDRCREEYMLQLADDLRWLGLDWDVGWQEGETAYCQSRRTEYYQDAFHRLQQERLIYPCFCTRRELLAASAPHASDGVRVYAGTCRGLNQKEREDQYASGRKPAWRISVPEEKIAFTDGNYGNINENLFTQCGDFILRRSDGVYAYQLAVTEDDGNMGVNRVVRGSDLLSSTARQIWLMTQLGYQVPEYCHVPLLLSEDGRRLSKRDRDLDMGVLRKKLTSEQVIGFLGYTAGLLDRPEKVSPEELISVFSWTKIGKQDIIVNSAELDRLFRSGTP